MDLEFSLSLIGCLSAAMAIVSTAGHQILVRHLQMKHSLQPDEFMLSTAPAQAAILIIVGPFLDKAAFGKWIVDYAWTQVAIFLVAWTCVLAVLMNLSQAACLGKFSALSFQVMGHAKTILILLGSCAWLGEEMSPLKLCGITIAMIGMAGYSYSKSKAPAAPRSNDTGHLKDLSQIFEEGKGAGNEGFIRSTLQSHVQRLR